MSLLPISWVRECCRLALLMAASVGVAAESATNSAFPDPSPHFGLAEVVTRAGTPVRFVQLLEYHCKTTCTDDDLSVMDGDRLVTDGMENRRVYAWFRGGGKYLRGWLPAANVKELRFARHPAYGKWQGTWMVGDARQIVIKAEPATNALAISASAEWHGGRLENGEQVIHTGDMQGKATPAGNRLVVRDENCVMELELVDEFLGAEDNMQCGGMNVSFSDVYTRDASTGIALR